MNCDCIKRIDDKLKPKGLKLSKKLLLFAVGEKQLGLSMACAWPLERLDGKQLRGGDPRTLRMSHCPFCGTKSILE